MEEDTPRRRRRNFKRDCPESYNRWLNDTRLPDCHFKHESDAAYLDQADEVARRLPTDDPYDPVTEYRRKGSRTYDQTTAHQGDVRARPIWEAEHFNPTWDPDDDEGDEEHPSLEDQLDNQPEFRQELLAAFYLPKRRRFPAIDRLLDEAEERCGADFAEQMYELTCKRFSDYPQHCLEKKANMSRRGRHKQAPVNLAVGRPFILRSKLMSVTKEVCRDYRNGEPWRVHDRQARRPTLRFDPHGGLQAHQGASVACLAGGHRSVGAPR